VSYVGGAKFLSVFPVIRVPLSLTLALFVFSSIWEGALLQASTLIVSQLNYDLMFERASVDTPNRREVVAPVSLGGKK
jgi:hypothetical protein